MYLLHYLLGTDWTKGNAWRGRADWLTRPPGTLGMSITSSMSTLFSEKHSENNYDRNLMQFSFSFFFLISRIPLLLFSHVSLF